MFHKGSYWWFRRTQYIPRFGGVLQECGDFTWRVSDCEELVGFTKLNHDLNDTVSVFDLKQLPRDSQL
jgi:hypothetical protein